MGVFGMMYRARERYRAESLLKRRRARAKERLAQFQQPYKLHIGCGQNHFAGWVHLDDNEELEHADIIWDVNQGLPLPDNSCELIHSEHVLEHFTVEQGVALFRECHRVLRPGGVMRVAMPCLDALIERFVGNWRDQPWLQLPEYHFIQTKAEMINVAFRWWDHKWLYNSEELQRRLREAGFANVRDEEWGKSSVAELRNRETRLESVLVCEAIK